jgi:hypothetical protein
VQLFSTPHSGAPINFYPLQNQTAIRPDGALKDKKLEARNPKAASRIETNSNDQN